MPGTLEKSSTRGELVRFLGLVSLGGDDGLVVGLLGVVVCLLVL